MVNLLPFHKIACANISTDFWKRKAVVTSRGYARIYLQRYVLKMCLSDSYFGPQVSVKMFF